MQRLILVLLVAGCHLPDTASDPDAGHELVRYRLGLTTRYQDPTSALQGLSVWVDGRTRQVSEGTIVEQQFANMELAEASSHTLEVRHGQALLHQVVQRPGDTCSSERGDGNRLVSETVNLCVRSNGEIQLNDFSCEYERTGYFTADVFCPTDCHPLLGGAACAGERCGLVLSNLAPRFGRLACVAEGAGAEGAFCRPPKLGAADECAAGLACVAGGCRRFCVTAADCAGHESCESALSNDAEPRVCIDPLEAPLDDLAQ